MPTTFLTASEIAKKNPALIEKRYLLEIAEVSKKDLEAKLSLKETWAWEISNEGWKKIQAQFTDLNLDVNAPDTKRFAALEALDDKTRQRIDAFARTSIVDAHPEWIAEALKQANNSQKIVGLSEGKSTTPFIGLNSGKNLIEILDAAPIKGSKTTTEAEKTAQTALNTFTGDNNTYYSIVVIEKAPKAEILTFAQAERKGALDIILDKQLEEYYLKIRDATPSEFQASDKSWKSFADVKDAVADKYFDKLLKGLRVAYASAIAPEKPQDKLINDLAATYRLYPYVRDTQQKLSKEPSLAKSLIKDSATESQPESVKQTTVPSDQWKLEKSDTKITKSSADVVGNKDFLFAVTPGEFSRVTVPANGDIHFFFVKERGNQTSDITKAASVLQAHRLLADGAEIKLMQQILEEIAAKKAISLEYIDQSTVSEPVEENVNVESNLG